ncbi:MAG: dephospho-CoA kinase [Gemmatimonadaceae bacterium]|nr:dephospho-CoA kinase [Gemmatimonadaceae bacterium]
MFHVGLTGNIGSGKSTVAARLAARGAMVLDADSLARDAVAHGTPGRAAVVARFGSGVIRRDGSLDRPALGRIVFANPGALADLEAIVHPEVFRLWNRGLEAARERRAKVVVSDMPLLFETGLDGCVDFIVVVDAPEEDRLKRLVERRRVKPDDARAMMAAQAPVGPKKQRASFVIENTGTEEALATQIDALWKEISARAATHP